MAANDNTKPGDSNGLFSLLNLMRLAVASFILYYFAYISGAAEFPFLDRSAPSYSALSFPGSAAALTGQDAPIVLYGDKEALTHGPSVVAFWASWCGVCKRKLPTLAERAEEFHQAGLNMAFVASESSRLAGPESLPDWMKKPGITVLYDHKGTLFEKLGIHAVPTYGLADAQGNITALFHLNVNAIHPAQDLADLAAPGDESKNRKLGH